MAEKKPCNCGNNSNKKLLFERKPVEKMKLPNIVTRSEERRVGKECRL